MKKKFNLFVAAIMSIVGTGLFTACGSDSFTDSRDGQKYKTVKIGEQIWMAENLKYKTETSKCPNDDPEMCDKYGRLYQAGYMFVHDNGFLNLIWEYIDGYIPFEACPDGWRLPYAKDFQKLVAYTDSITQGKIGTGKALKAKEGWDDDGGIDAVGFNATPAFKDEKKVTYLSIPHISVYSKYAPDFAYHNVSDVSLDKGVNVKLEPIHPTVDKETKSWVRKIHAGANYSIRCIKKDSAFYNLLSVFPTEFFEGFVRNIENHLNDTTGYRKGLWSEQDMPQSSMYSRIYFDVNPERFDNLSERLRKSKVSIENKIEINGCPAKSKWTLEVERLGEENIYLSKYQCSLEEPADSSCRGLISRENFQKLNNSDCVGLTPYAIKKGEEIKAKPVDKKVLKLLTK